MFDYLNISLASRETLCNVQIGPIWLIFLGIWEEAELVLGIWGAKAKYLQGAEDFFQGFGEIDALFIRCTGGGVRLRGLRNKPPITEKKIIM